MTIDENASVMQRLLYVLLVRDTTLLRFWFAICTFAWGIWIFCDPNFDTRHHVLAAFMNHAYIGSTGLAWLFLANGAVMMAGAMSNYYSRIMLLAEPVLACLLWSLVAITDWMILQSAAPTLGGALVALFLVTRYPTHYTIPNVHGGARAPR